MRRPFCEHHLLLLLEEYDRNSLPLDFSMHQYLRAHKALGSKDRGTIANTVYGMVRWKGLLDHLCQGKPSWEKRVEIYKDFFPQKHLNDETIPPHIRVSFPKELFQLLVNSHGEEKAWELCLASNTQAPTTVRVNALKTSRNTLLKQWKSEGYDVFPCKETPEGIVFKNRMNFFSLPEFKKGLFEVQDEGSQLIAALVDAKPGQWIMDYCSGSGGKSLAIAPQMENRGQIFLHDIRKKALQEARKRLKRAGIQNAQMTDADDMQLRKMKKKMDWVLVDAPCSGTGTLRRNPDMKWKFNRKMLDRLIAQQRVIFEKALSYLKPEGRIVYTTCSLLHEENRDQTEHFINTYHLDIEGETFTSLPTVGGMDGFYGVVLKRKAFQE